MFISTYNPYSVVQVVYILDQVRALERELTARLEAAGLEDVHPDIVVVTRLIPEAHGTTCNERLEHITGTAHARILRVPFRDREGRVLRKWISRFDLWPYLERFTIDATKEILAELGGKPQFLIGNYSDGNLVATLVRYNTTSRKKQSTLQLLSVSFAKCADGPPSGGDAVQYCACVGKDEVSRC